MSFFTVHRLAMLRLETSSLFEIMSKTFADTKSRLIFLINTFDLVLTLLAVRQDTHGQLSLTILA